MTIIEILIHPEIISSFPWLSFWHGSERFSVHDSMWRSPEPQSRRLKTEDNGKIIIINDIKIFIMRTTVDLPSELIADLDSLLEQKNFGTRNKLIISALKEWVATQKEADIDQAFTAMGDDPDYQAESLALESEFEISDSEVAQIG